MDFALLNGNRVQASEKLDYNLNYLCPYAFCTSPELILKKGNKIPPYFSHKSGGLECEVFTERGTKSHRAMKYMMQRLLEIPNDQMEYGKIKQVRPDLVLFCADMKFALEVQHSSITYEERDRRDGVYLNNGFVPIWIFHRQERAQKVKYERGIYCFLRKKKDPEGKIQTKPKDVEWFEKNCHDSLLYLSFEIGSRPLLELTYIEPDEEPYCKVIDRERIYTKERLIAIFKERIHRNNME